MNSQVSSESSTRVLRRLLLLAWEHRKRCLALMLYQLGMLGLGVVALALSGRAIDAVHAELAPGTAAPVWPGPLARLSTWQVLIAVALAILLIAFVRAVLNYLYTISVADLVHGEVVPEVRAKLYTQLHQLSLRFFSAHPSGSLLNRITSDVHALRSFLEMVVIQSAVMLLALAINVGYMLTRHVGLTLVCVATTPVMAWITTRFSRRIQSSYATSRDQMDELVLQVSEAIQGVAVVKGFSAEPAVIHKFAAQNALVRDGQQRIFEQVSRFTPSVDLLSQANVIGLLCYGGWLVAGGALSVGDLVVFAGLLQQLSTQVGTMSGVVNTLQESLIGARRVFEVLDAPLEIADPPRPVRSRRSQPSAAGSVRIERVDFAYEPGRPVLHQLDFELRPGECVALFGAAGAGKSTLLSLLPRFYDVSTGRILLDGQDIRELPLAALRRNFGCVFQETFLFSHSVAANIAFGDPYASPEQIRRAAELACAAEFIDALPNGYETVLGEFGANLSGGQRQRLALARALLSEPRILILDDPTAALDAHTAQEIVNGLRRGLRGRSALLATHHPALLRSADRILVLHEGRLIQSGSHAQLTAAEGAFSEVFGRRRSQPGERRV